MTFDELKELKVAECKTCDNYNSCNPERDWKQCVSPDEWDEITEKYT